MVALRTSTKERIFDLLIRDALIKRVDKELCKMKEYELHAFLKESEISRSTSEGIFDLLIRDALIERMDKELSEMGECESHAFSNEFDRNIW